MITLDKNSKFVKYWVRLGCTERGFNQLINGYTDYNKKGYPLVPPGTNLCQLARINLYALIKTAMVVGGISFVLMLFIHNPSLLWGIPIVVGFVCASFLAAWLLVTGFKRIKGTIPDLSDTLPIQYYKAWKGKYCPIIKFEEDK